MGQIKIIQVGSHKIRYVMDRVLPLRSVYITDRGAIFRRPPGQSAPVHRNDRRLVVPPIFRWRFSKPSTDSRQISTSFSRPYMSMVFGIDRSSRRPECPKIWPTRPGDSVRKIKTAAPDTVRSHCCSIKGSAALVIATCNLP